MRSWVAILLATSAVAWTGCRAQETIRIRFADGKTGKPLKLKYYSVTADESEYYNYKIDRIERDALVVTFPDSKKFAFSNDAYVRCDTNDKSAPEHFYNIQEILEKGVVSENICGPFHAQPTKGELLIYSRREHWWEFVARLPKGLICG